MIVPALNDTNLVVAGNLVTDFQSSGSGVIDIAIGAAGRWRADTGVTSVGGLVSAWASSIVGADILSAVGAARPTLTNNSLLINNKPFIQFNSATNLDGVLTGAGAGIFPGHIFCLFAKVNPYTAGYVFDFKAGGVSQNKLYSNNNQNTVTPNAWGALDIDGAGTQYFLAVQTTNTLVVYEVVTQALVDGVGGSLSASNADELKLGVGAFGIAELVVYETELGANDLQQTLAYFFQRYSTGVIPVPITFPEDTVLTPNT